MIKPTNSTAESIVNMRVQNDSLQIHVDQYQKQIEANNLAIAALEPSATWEDVLTGLITPTLIL
jgi:LEA14-like dessication related protein